MVEYVQSPVVAQAGQTKGVRFGERSVVISLQRENCPFCGHDIVKFRGCPFCGQKFIWASVPLD